MSRRAFFVIGPEGSGTYMLAEAFVAAGCTYCDKDDVAEFLKGQQPELLVLRRSLPHAGEWQDINRIRKLLRSFQYIVCTIAIIRDNAAAYKSVIARKGTKDPRETYTALQEIGKALYDEIGTFITYEYFVKSKSYRKELFKWLNLPEPEMEFYDANAKYYV